MTDPQLGDALTEGVCFDTGLARGNRDSRFGDPPSKVSVG
jgi:hypothetical protein